MRLDRVVVSRGLARSRTQAQELIAAGSVRVDGEVQYRASVDIADAAAVTVSDDTPVYVSRAAHKLAGALDACAPLGLTVQGRAALDAGASTGGFTQVLLERAAASVLAVDVGHGQLAPELRDHPRVTAVEGLNVRDMGADTPGTGVDLVVADLSFISLTLVIPALVAFAGANTDMVLMVKPQFEVGRQRLGRGGVVTDLDDRKAAVDAVARCMVDNGLDLHHIERSPLPGPSGNVEFFIWGSLSWQARDMAGDAVRTPPMDAAAVAAAIDAEVRRDE